jgi:hypothetical protein
VRSYPFRDLYNNGCNADNLRYIRGRVYFLSPQCPGRRRLPRRGCLFIWSLGTEEGQREALRVRGLDSSQGGVGRRQHLPRQVSGGVPRKNKEGKPEK